MFTFLNSTANVTCCHPNTTSELVTCGLGASCAGKCSALGASLCPSGNCSGDCELPLDLEIEEVQSRRWSSSTRPSSAFKWCSPRCNVWRNRGCCYNPVCGRKRRRACRWMNFLTGIVSIQANQVDDSYSGKTCPLPGSLPKGNWSCQTQEVPIVGTSFLDEDAQSYPGIPSIHNLSYNHQCNLSSALQCRLECQPGYISPRTPLITCVNGEYAKWCHDWQPTPDPIHLCFLPILH